MKPKRIQRKRIKGWKKPEGAMIVDRTSRWGNPFKIGSGVTREQSVRLFEQYLKAMPKGKREEFLEPLRGKDLLCYCKPDEKCHADVLLKWANRSASLLTATVFAIFEMHFLVLRALQLLSLRASV